MEVKDLSHVFVSTVAGGGESGWLDGPAVAARFGNRLWGVAVDPVSKSVYVADTDNHRVRIVKDGDVSTLAGNGSGGFASGPALTKAQMQYPYGLTVDSRGTVYVTDRENQRIRCIRNGHVEVFAGSGTSSWREDGPALRASFNDPTGITIDDDTDTVYVSDHGSSCIRAIRDGCVVTVAGAGTLGFADGPANEAKFNTPWQMAYDPISMALYIADYGNHRIRKLQNGLVTTVAGTGVPGCEDGPVSSATLYHPVGIAVDPRSQAIFCTDYSGHRVRMIHNGYVTTVCGAAGAGLHDGHGPKSRFRNPASIALDLDNYKLYICDMGNHRIRVFSAKFLTRHVRWRPLSFKRLLATGSLSDLALTICGHKLQLHRCIVRHRCAALLDRAIRNKLDDMNVTETELNIVTEYIYCDRVPAVFALSPTAWLRLSEIGDVLRVDAFAASCAAQIKPSLCSSPGTALDILSQALESREESLAALIPVCIEALVEQREVLLKTYSPKLLAERLKDYPHYYHAIVDTISPSTSPTSDSPSPLASSGHSISHPGLSAYSVPSPRVKSVLGEDMEKLFESGQDYDFTIVIGTGDNSIKIPCHAAVLYASWTYFRHMWASGMRESTDRILKLPGSNHPDGITEAALRLLLRYAYTGRIPRQNIDPFDALYLLGRADLYGLSAQTSGGRRYSFSTDSSGAFVPDRAPPREPQNDQEKNHSEADLSFRPLIDFCLAVVEKSLEPSNCVQIYKAAVDLGAYDASAKARQFVVSHLKQILKTIDGKFHLLQLPQMELNMLFLEYIADH